MWVVIVFPPLVWPLGVDRPTACRRCASKGPFHVHERRTASIANVRRISPTGAEQVVSQPVVRFRCGRCGSTSTRPSSNRMAGFRLQWFLSSKIIVWYALGWPLANIQAYLGAMGTPVSRSTMVRVIDVAGDDRLRAIHWQNRRRVAMMAARGRPFRFVQGSWETGLAGEFASALATPAQVFERRDDRGAGSVVLRLTALVFSSYKTPALEAALNWLDSYHRFIGSGGVLRFASRRSLDKAFSVEEPLPHNLAIQRGAIRPNSIGGDLNTASPYVRQAVVSALRMVDQPGDDG